MDQVGNKSYQSLGMDELWSSDSGKEKHIEIVRTYEKNARGQIDTITGSIDKWSNKCVGQRGKDETVFERKTEGWSKGNRENKRGL